ncbi:unnamed protein product [Closterium sp. Naga37s-1]|nr:unnamed protein product [Closterium sp. Naga37s-1]
MKNMMQTAVAEVSKTWHDILTMIRRDFPYFNRTNGRDHFSTSTFDHGRCHALTWVIPDLYGEMFFVMLNGDRLARTMHASVERNLQIIGYNYIDAPLQPQFPDVPCYMPDRDIVVPAFIGDQIPMVSPFTGDRPMRAIFRFSAHQGHNAPLMHHGHDLRPELLAMYAKQRIKGWSFAAKLENQTSKDWQKAVFCICPPGHSQWTSRPFKALISGCIPVTFFRDHDNPWGDELDYSSFSINIDPDDIASMRYRLETAPVEQLQLHVLVVVDESSYGLERTSVPYKELPPMSFHSTDVIPTSFPPTSFPFTSFPSLPFPSLPSPHFLPLASFPSRFLSPSLPP